jgi:hypothetical protein
VQSGRDAIAPVRRAAAIRRTQYSHSWPILTYTVVRHIFHSTVSSLDLGLTRCPSGRPPPGGVSYAGGRASPDCVWLLLCAAAPRYSRPRRAAATVRPYPAAGPEAPMKVRKFLFPLVALAVAGCSSWEPPWDAPAGDPVNLSLACEMTKCECRPPISVWSFSDTPGKPVSWRADGSAYCPAGLALNRAAE